MRQIFDVDEDFCADDRFLNEERMRLHKNMSREQRKLEEMIVELFARGRRNLGADKRILEQSGILDKLVVDEMLLDEMLQKADNR